MASQDNFLTRIITLVRGLDDASWEALASKGLLRRARKELEGGLQVQVVGETESALTLVVPPFQVSIPSAGPARAQCTCPAPGICQHILAAGLYLQGIEATPEDQASTTTPASIRDEVAPLHLERLKTWAGPADYRAGIALFERNSLPTTIEYSESVLIRLMPSAIEARFVPGGGLDGMILPQTNANRVAVAAVLALRKSLGFEMPKPDQQQALITQCRRPASDSLSILAGSKSSQNLACSQGSLRRSAIALQARCPSGRGTTVPLPGPCLRSL